MIESAQSHVACCRFGRRALLGGAIGGLLGGARLQQASASARGGSFHDLDDDPDSWGIWIDPGDAPRDSIYYDTPHAVDGSDGTGQSLRMAINGGYRPYTHLHGYRTLPPLTHARAVELRMRWRFSDTTWNNEGAPSAVQMIEPAMNLWDGAQRYEWALQWQNVWDGSGGDPHAPAWRIWNGSSWQTTGFEQRLLPNTWHDLRLRGELHDGAIRYVQMVSDDLSIKLGDEFAPTPALEEARSAVTMQLGGNANLDPYDCCIDRVELRWWAESPW